jgi:hypothetical protein
MPPAGGAIRTRLAAGDKRRARSAPARASPLPTAHAPTRLPRRPARTSAGIYHAFARVGATAAARPVEQVARCETLRVGSARDGDDAPRAQGAGSEAVSARLVDLRIRARGIRACPGDVRSYARGMRARTRPARGSSIPPARAPTQRQRRAARFPRELAPVVRVGRRPRRNRNSRAPTRSVTSALRDASATRTSWLSGLQPFL